MSRGDHPSSAPGPFDWQAEEDLELWRAELAATYPIRNGGLFSDLDMALEMLKHPTARSLPRWAHD